MILITAVLYSAPPRTPCSVYSGALPT